MATIDWTPVEEAEAEKTPAGYKLALLEASKILAQRLQEERVPGNTLAEQVTAGRWHFTRPDDLDKSVAFIETLRAGPTSALTLARAKEYLQAFRQAVADLSDLAQRRDSFGAQVKLQLGRLKGQQRWLLRILIGLGAFLLLVLFLADTTIGQILVTGVVGLVHLFFGVIVAILLVIALIVAVIVGTAIFLDRQGGGGRIKEEDE